MHFRIARSNRPEFVDETQHPIVICAHHTMSQSTLESTLEQLSLAVHSDEPVLKSHIPGEKTFDHNLEAHMTGDSDSQSTRYSPDTTETIPLPEHSRPSDDPTPDRWARQLFEKAAAAAASCLADTNMANPDRILDDHMARVWRRRARDMMMEDRIEDSDDPRQLATSGRPYRSRHRRGTHRETREYQ
ncbi:unnamed protein product [Echinostoma caproni]|uniref:Uncharacterized protein n=1 Tax=Echinostoma caproni TaxID=27848 RepID=A0A183A654_9TREM|nr:unnamed protein product [Echinostoma caproni]